MPRVIHASVSVSSATAPNRPRRRRAGRRSGDRVIGSSSIGPRASASSDRDDAPTLSSCRHGLAPVFAMLAPMSGIGSARPLPDPGSGARARGARAVALSRSTPLRRVAGVIVLALAYRGIAEVGYALQFAGPVAAIVWLPVGVGIAFLYRFGLRFWPGVLIGDLLANDYGHLPLGSAVGQTAGNVLEVIVATVLLMRLVPRGEPLS